MANQVWVVRPAKLIAQYLLTDDKTNFNPFLKKKKCINFLKCSHYVCIFNFLEFSGIESGWKSYFCFGKLTSTLSSFFRQLPRRAFGYIFRTNTAVCVVNSCNNTVSYVKLVAHFRHVHPQQLHQLWPWTIPVTSADVVRSFLR